MLQAIDTSHWQLACCDITEQFQITDPKWHSKQHSYNSCPDKKLCKDRFFRRRFKSSKRGV
jgi:hypothetical protein